MHKSSDDNVQEIPGAMDSLGTKWGTRTTPAEPFFVTNRAYQTTFQQLSNGRFSPHLATKRESMSHRNVSQDIFENFSCRAPWLNRHFTLISLQPTGHIGDEYCSLHVIVQRPRSFPVFCRTYGFGATGRQSSQFSYFYVGLFFLYKIPKKYRWPSYSQRVTLQNVVGVPGVFLRSLVWELGIPKFSPMWNACIICTMILRASDLNQRPQNTQFSAQRCAFWDVDDVPLNFGSKTPKNKNFGPMNGTIKHERQKFKHITSALLRRSQRSFYKDSHHEWTFASGPTSFPNKSNTADGSNIEFRKNANISIPDEDICSPIWYKHATRGRPRTTTARRLSAYTM